MNKLYPLFLLVIVIQTGFAQTVSLTTMNSPYHQDFNTLASTGSSNVLPSGWLISETGTNANGTYTAGTGSGNTGDTYSFGSAGSTDRALGGLRSGSLVPVIGASFTNNTGGSINGLNIQFQGEQWRLGTSGRGSDRLDFQISFNATSLSSGTWTHVDELDFIGPVNTGTTGAIAGGSSVAVSFEIGGQNILPGQTFFIRWTDLDVSGADDGLSIDNFSLTPIGNVIEPSISFSPSSLSFGDVFVNQSSTLSYQVAASNLTSAIAIESNNSIFTVSSDNVSFGSSATLPQGGGQLFVKFSPLVNGAATATLNHSSGTYSKTFTVAGNGYDPLSNIISIAIARGKSVGTRVTVAGRVTVANQLGNPAYIQDASGGIPVFDSNLATSVTIGDSVIVTGPIGVFNDQKQISGTGITFTEVDAPSFIPEPKVIDISQLAANEGLLVTVSGVELVNKNFVFFPQSTEQITNGSTTADLRIDGDTDIPGLTKPSGIVNITGVVGRFRTNAQLLPRFQPDIPGANEPVLPTDGIAKSLTLDVVNWNLEFFGAEREDYGEEFGPADEPLQLANVHQVLQSLDADIIAVQEVSDEGLLATLVAQMPGYAYTCSQRYSYSFEGPSDDFPPQKVCFIYNDLTIDVVSSRVMFEALYDEARTTNPALLPNYPSGDPSSFYSSGRLPYLLTVDATINGVTDRISLVTVHAKSGATSADYARRAYDAAVLKDTLDQHFANAQVIYLGDLNDDLDQSIVSGMPSSYQNFVNDNNYLSITKPLSEAGARSTVTFQDVIDHQILSTELEEEFLEGSAAIVTPFRTIPNYGATTSDHLPVISRYMLTSPVANFSVTSESVNESPTTMTHTISLSKPASFPTSLTVAIGGTATYGSDFTTSPSPSGNSITVEFAEGQSSAQLSISLLDDVADEDSESITLSFTSMNGIVAGAGNSYSLAIADNDTPTVSFEIAQQEVAEGTTTQINVSLSSGPVTGQTVTIQVNNSPKVQYGKDYTTSPENANGTISLSIPAGTSVATINLDAILDKKKEKPETITFNIISASEGLILGSQLQSVVTLINTRRHPHFAAWPNPTSNVFAINSEEIDEDEILSVEVRSNSGHRVFAGQGTLAELNAKLALSFSNAKKGLYIMLINYDDEVYTLRISRN